MLPLPANGWLLFPSSWTRGSGESDNGGMDPRTASANHGDDSADIPSREVPPAVDRRRGVTLLELIIVVVIIGLVAGMANYFVTNYRDQVRLRQASEQIHQVVSWAKLQAEKTGDTVILKISLPAYSVWRDKNGTGQVEEASDTRLLNDSVASNVRASKPVAGPSEASVAAPASGFAQGAGTCGAGVCCTRGSASTPSWSDRLVNICPRTSPPLPPQIEDGALYLASANSSVEERWAIVLNRTKSGNPTLWTAQKAPKAAGDWRKVR